MRRPGAFWLISCASCHRRVDHLNSHLIPNSWAVTEESLRHSFKSKLSSSAPAITSMEGTSAVSATRPWADASIDTSTFRSTALAKKNTKNAFESYIHFCNKRRHEGWLDQPNGRKDMEITKKPTKVPRPLRPWLHSRRILSRSVRGWPFCLTSCFTSETTGQVSGGAVAFYLK
ncbi:hypothetical protein N658DRAFT_25442 [Parathielavia hyrcaniae]|uniref:Uncharacterized protein n=1 Tax=Parathielavia hyrcaniae TaxID=113614 RepID=A0AAN6T6I8_9PEZI|nr:hypothetical protein N658DRAFT_25442 [Parathielavia hyrcaniae]